jgi:hypothetical protein
MRESELQLNRIAQGIVSLDAGLQWFGALSSSEQGNVLNNLAHMTHQAHPRTEELAPAILRSGLKETFTPCVVLQTSDRPTQALSRIAALPESEHLKSFRLLMALFSIADARRRESECKDGCTHEWHNLAAL